MAKIDFEIKTIEIRVFFDQYYVRKPFRKECIRVIFAILDGEFRRYRVVNARIVNKIKRS